MLPAAFSLQVRKTKQKQTAAVEVQPLGYMSNINANSIGSRCVQAITYTYIDMSERLNTNKHRSTAIINRHFYCKLYKQKR